MAAAMEGPGGKQREWYLARDGQQYGPITQRELNALHTMGDLRSDDLLWREGWQTWRVATALNKSAIVHELQEISPTPHTPAMQDKPERPIEATAVGSRREFKSLRVLSPMLNFLIVIGLVARPFLEHFGKRSDALPLWTLYTVPFLLICVYITVGAAAFFFQRASQNINTFAGKSVLVPGPWSAWLMCVPFVNIFAIPWVWARTYYHSLSFLPELRIAKSRAAAVGISAFALLAAGHAAGLVSDNAALWPRGYDAMSLSMIAVCLGTGGAMLFSQIVRRVHAAQKTHAAREGLTERLDDGDRHGVVAGIVGKLRLAAVGLFIAAAVFTMIYPIAVSSALQRLLATTAQVPQPARKVAPRDEVLRAAADELNKSGPQMVDKATRLDGVRIEEDHLIYEYTLLLQNVTADQFERLAVSIKSQAVPAYCEGALKVFRDLNARVGYRYRYPGGVQIGQIILSGQDCKQ